MASSLSSIGTHRRICVSPSSMQRVLRFGTLAMLLLAAATGTSEAFDGKRTGFILGGGLGAGATSFTQEVAVIGGPSDTSDRETKGGLATDFKIGYGFDERILLYYVNRVSWFGLKNALGKNVTIANGVGLAGMSYYLNDSGPGGYLVGTLGVATWDAPFEDSGDIWTGFGIGAGGGFEFSRHWSIEGTVNFGKPGLEDKDLGVEVTSTAVALLVTLTGLAY